MTDKEQNTDELLRQGLVRVPENFHTEVMQQVATYERARQQSNHTAPQTGQQMVQESAGLEWWQWLALVAGGVLGAGQVIRFIFAVWLVSTCLLYTSDAADE